MASDCPRVPYGPEDALGYYGYDNHTEMYTGRDMDLVATVSCRNEDNYTLMFVGYHHYDFLQTIMCTVVPRIVPVQVDYSDIINVEIVNDPATSVPDPDGPTANAAIWALGLTLANSQGVVVNSVGEEWLALASAPDWTNQQTLILVENYVRGFIEYSASIFRGCSSGFNMTFENGIPPNMTRETTGKFHSESLGWTYVSGTVCWVLVPGSVIALATILVVCVAVFRHVGTMPDHPFDPANPLHLVAAAAGGGLNNVFRGLESKAMREGERTSVVLGWIPDAGPALLRTHDGPLLQTITPRSP
ncbi:hypothetical protein B0H19DRAFT_1263713 [Mycena capillaripes]|nr:hypothetical protein B0H19DRAFT_1263713 [Mycena capillaripes]